MVQNLFVLIVQIVDYLLQLFKQSNVIAVLAVGVFFVFNYGFASNVVETKKLHVVIINIFVQNVDLLLEIMMFGNFLIKYVLDYYYIWGFSLLLIKLIRKN